MDKLTLLKNARIYPRCTRGETCSTLVISGSKILHVGDGSITNPWQSQADEIIDLEGRTILPGITDAHIHLEKYALSIKQVDCETSTVEGCLDRLRAAARSSPPGSWIRGHGWDQNRWGRFGSLEEIDAASPKNPVYLTAKSLHAGWANSLALHECDLKAPIRPIAGGHMGTEPDGRLNGLLFEEAMKLVSDKIPRPSAEQIRASIEEAQDRLLRYGITSVHDFDGQRCFSALQELRRSANLRIRVVKNIQKAQLAAVQSVGLQSGFGDDWLRIGHLKLFADGALGPQTAAMLEPYEMQPDNQGILLLDQDEIYDIGREAFHAGLPLTVHAIGDRACRAVIRAFMVLEKEGAAAPLPPRIEHLQVVHPADFEDLAGANITVSMQPLHAPSDRPTAERYWAERSRWSYAWNAVTQTGSLLIFGSDAPVETPDPWKGLYAAVTRKLKDDDPDAPDWVPEERIDLETALKAYTVNPPIAIGMADRLGQLTTGYLADLILLDQDPFSIAPTELPNMNVLGAMTGGEWRVLEL